MMRRPENHKVVSGRRRQPEGILDRLTVFVTPEIGYSTRGVTTGPSHRHDGR